MKNKWLFLILTVAAFSRFFHLTSSPPALNWDEVSIGYNAYSILKTGRDEWGQFLPLAFKAFGEYKLPGMIYASIPGIFLFGLNDFGVRFTPALFGVLGVWLIYLLGKKLFGDKTGLFAAALLAISPWAIHFSRVSFEAGLAMVLTMASVYCLLNQRLWPTMIFAVLALYSYNSIRILLPLLFITYLLTQTLKFSRQLVLVLGAGIVLITPFLLDFARPETRVRWGTVSIASQKSFVDGIAESRGYTTLPSILPRLIHNKATHYVYAVGMNYLRHFDTNFLFFAGGTNTQRSIQGMGLLYLFELPLLILGLIKLTPPVRRVLLPWLLLAPIPSALTIDSPSTVRALGMLPPLILIEALGAATVIAFLRSHLITRWLAGIFVVWNVIYFAYLLFLVYPVKYSDAWAYGYKQAIQYASAHYDSADLIYLPAKYGEPYIYTLFYTRFDPARYQALQKSSSTDPLGWVHNSGFDKYRFSDYSGLETPVEIVARHHGNLVLVTGFATLPPDYTRTFEVRAPNWKVMFEGTIQQGEL